MIRVFTAAVQPGQTPHEAAYALLAQAASEVWGLPSLPEIARTELGKPYFPSLPHCHFNLSDSESLVACALSDRPVGIDIEFSHPLRMDVSKRFTAGEQRFLSRQPPELFFALWVKKEAFLKATGAGLTRPLCSFSVLPLSENEAEGVRLRLFDTGVEGCWGAFGEA